LSRPAINGTQHANRAEQVEGGIDRMLAKPMTIGQLSRRTGVPIKALREYEQLGLIYTLGRSESNYRLFDEEALWCVQVIRTMRSLGLPLKEIQDLAAVYLERPDEPIGPHFGEKLESALARLEARVADLQALRQRIRDFQSAHAAELAGETELDLLASDPRHTLSKSPS
jgi:MerR family copper efflux transcriptional regulator